MFRVIRSLLIVITASVMLTGGALVQADDGDDTGDRIEVNGPVTALSADSITVQGIIFDITAAKIEIDLVLDLEVHVEGMYDGEVFIATEVSAWTDDDDDDDDDSDDDIEETIEVSGPITALGEETIIVYGIIFDITSAEITIEIAVDVVVHVEAVFEDDRYVALVVSASDMDDDDEDDDDDDDDNIDVSTVNISIEMAIEIVFSVFPNTTIIVIELEYQDDAPYWYIETSHDHEIEIDAMTGIILVIATNDDDDDHDDDDDDDDNNDDYDDDDYHDDDDDDDDDD